MKPLKSKTTLESDNEIFKKIKFNLEVSPPDFRDYDESKIISMAFEIPNEYLAKETKVLNQGIVGSCVAHACSSGLSQGDLTINKTKNEYSRGYIYGNRADSDHQGEGMHTREAIKQLNKHGDVFYKDFPYNMDYEAVKSLIAKDSINLSEKAAEHKIENYYRCYTNNEIKRAIMSRGCVISSIPVFDTFSRDLHLKDTKDANKEGNHAIIIVGWTSDNRWICQNSWGKYWGYNGKFYMDIDYPINEAWAITVKSNEKSNLIIRVFKNIINFISGLFSNNTK